jgi:hypothetical protein
VAKGLAGLVMANAVETRRHVGSPGSTANRFTVALHAPTPGACPHPEQAGCRHYLRLPRMRQKPEGQTGVGRS